MHPSVDRVWNRESAYRALLLLTAAAIGVLVVRQSWLYLAALLAFPPLYHGHGLQDGRRSLIVGNRETAPNIFAASLLLPLSLAVGEFLDATALFRRTLMLLAAGAIALAILVSMSRGALVALVTMVIVYLVKLRLSWRVFVPVMVLVVALL